MPGIIARPDDSLDRILRAFKKQVEKSGVIGDLKKTLPCAAYLNGEYGVKNLYVGVPVIIGKNGVEKIVQINLSEEEKNNFLKSINAVKELFESAIKIDPNLK